MGLNEHEVMTQTDTSQSLLPTLPAPALAIIWSQLESHDQLSLFNTSGSLREAFAKAIPGARLGVKTDSDEDFELGFGTIPQTLMRVLPWMGSLSLRMRRR